MPRTPNRAPVDPSRDTDGQALPLPHERDEAKGQVAPEVDPVIEQAARDIDAGLVDTDMRATPGLDADRREDMVPTPKAKRPATRRRT